MYCAIMKKNIFNKKFDFFSVFWGLFFIFIFFLLLYNSFGYLDPDLGWHLEAGRSIVNTKGAPDVNQHNYPLEGEKWVDHEWLLDAGTYALYESVGYIGVNIFFALLVVIVLMSLYRFVLRLLDHKQGAELPMMLFMLFGVVAMFPHVGVRMQEVTLLGVLILLILIYKVEESGKARKLLWTLPLFWLWANVHAGFLIGLFLLFSYGAIKAGELWVYNRCGPQFLHLSKVLPAKTIVKYFSASFLAAGATLLTPYGFRLYGFLGGYTNTFYLTHIREWLPQYFPPLNYWQIVYMGVVTATVLLTCIYAIYNKEKQYRIDLWWLFLTLLFLTLALKSRRHFPLLFIASFPFVINFHVLFFDWSRNILRQRLLGAVKIYLLATLILGSAHVAMATNFTERPFSEYCYRYPCRAVSFLERNPQYHNLRMFNYYGWGGYLIWTYPAGRLFIDGRLPQYQINDSTILEEYYEFFEQGRVGGMLDRYEVELVLFEKNRTKDKYDFLEEFIFFINEEELEPRSQNLLDFLSANRDWRVVFENDVSLIFLKKKASAEF